MNAHAAGADDGDSSGLVGLAEGELAIRGNATPDDVAAVLATLRELAARVPGGYEHWRHQRIRALRDHPPS